MISNVSASLGSTYAGILTLSFSLSGALGCLGSEGRELPVAGYFLDEKLSSSWPENLPPEEMKKVFCPAPRCLVIDPGSSYCALDPAYFPEEEASWFDHKLKLHLAATVLPLGNGTYSGLSIDVESLADRRRLLDSNEEMEFEIVAIEESTKFDEIRAVATVPSPISATHNAELSIGTVMQPKLWDQPHFRLGNPGSAWWWNNQGRRLTIRLSEEEAETMGVSEWIEFAPCDFEDLETEEIVFHFDEASSLKFLVKHQHYVDFIPHSAYRLISVTGVFEGRIVQVENYYNLAAFGSGPSNKHELPGLAFLISDLPKTSIDKRETCGLSLIPRRSTLPVGKRWRIRRLDCRGKQMEEEVQYQSAEIPDAFSFPNSALSVPVHGGGPKPS